MDSPWRHRESDGPSPTQSGIGFIAPIAHDAGHAALRRPTRTQPRRRAHADSEVSIPFVHPIYVRCILDCLSSRGVSPLDVIAHVGLDWQDLGNGSPWVDFSVFRRLVTHAVERSGEPALGLIAGSMLQPYHSPLGIAAVTSESLGQGLRFATQYASLVFRTLDFQAETGPQWRTLRVTPKRPLGETHEFVMQFLLGAYLRLVEAILGRPVDELMVGLPFDRPAGSDMTYMRYFRRVEFNHDVLTLQLPVGLLSTPSVSADADAFLAAARACWKMASEVGYSDFVLRVRQALQERLPNNPALGTLAQDLGVSDRTLVRRLTEAGLSFSDLKDGLRKSHAVWYLQHTELSMEAIASQLGYNDPTNFSRKFKSWYEVTPQKMRQAYRRGVEH